MAASESQTSACHRQSESYTNLKDAYSSGTLAQPLLNFNIGTILTYFLETRADFKAIRENAFELFTSGHVQDTMVKYDELAKKVIITAQCLAQMKTNKYRVVMMLNDSCDIIHASCGCPAGSGPSCSCKHVAALCYTLEDFIKTFVLPEDVPSCTDKLEAWNKPRDVKLPAIPIYDVDFERKRYGKKRKQQRALKGNPPDFYRLQTVCEGQKEAATTFLTELRDWGSTANKGILMNTVASVDDPVEQCSTVNPLYIYRTDFQREIENICKSDSDNKINKVKDCLKVTEIQQNLIITHTLLQSRVSDWYFLRKFRITGSIVGRICNFYKYKRSNPEKIASSILDPPSYTSAAMKYGLELEPAILDRYKTEKNSAGGNISLKKLGLIVDRDHGFVAASPDSGVEDNGILTGLVECKTAVKWSNKTVTDCVRDSSYPLQSVTIDQNGTAVRVIQLKLNHPWFHQMQLQLYVCRQFAKYCDLAYLHPQSGSFHCQKFKLSDEWVTKCIPQLEDFFNRFLAPKIIEKFNK